MANYSDLEELGINDAEDALTVNFTKAADHLKNLVSTLDNQTLLTLYAYYKQGLEGPCTAPKPSWYDMRGKSKWEAWKQLNDLPADEAKRIYIEKIRDLDPDFNQTDGIKESWVRVSTLQHHNQSTAAKNIADFIKDKNLGELQSYLKALSPTELDQLDSEGLAILHWSADSGNVEAMELIISAGADINVQDSDGQTALHYASSCGHTDCVELLLNYNAKIDILDNDGATPVMVAFDDTVKSMLIPS